MKKKNPQNRNIIRIENINRLNKVTAGYEVRILRRGERFSRFFSDVKYGKLGALKLARFIRDEMEAKMKVYTRKELAQKRSAKNTSGERGIRLRVTMITTPTKKYRYEHVEASWSPEPHVVVKKAFSVEKFGFEGAWKMAVRCRKKGMSKIIS